MNTEEPSTDGWWEIGANFKCTTFTNTQNQNTSWESGDNMYGICALHIILNFKFVYKFVWWSDQNHYLQNGKL